MSSVLITGGAGFIGSNFIPYFLRNNPSVNVINIDSLTYAGDLKNLQEVEDHKNYHFIKGDICNQELVNSIFEEAGKHSISIEQYMRKDPLMGINSMTLKIAEAEKH